MSDEQWVDEFLDSLSPEVREILRRPTARQAARLEAQSDHDPPSYFPVREPLQPRIPDLCPDDWNEK